MAYLERVYRLPAVNEDLLIAELYLLGASGFQSTDPDLDGEIELKAFFADGGAAELDAASAAALAVEILGGEEIAEKDWLADYRALARPIEVGSRFVCDPRDVDDPAVRQEPPELADGRILLHIPAQTAFGTGSHESTRLAIELLEDEAAAGRLQGGRVLDVGTGSGILCFVAEKLGAAFAAGYDIDAPAVCIAHLNAKLNHCSARLFAADAAALQPRPSFDLLLVNELPERILGEYPPILECLRPGGRVISSGNLLVRREELLAAFAGLGLEPAGERRAGEWVGFTFVKA
jgi:ribosomal protein L11 methyltransferase